MKYIFSFIIALLFLSCSSSQQQYKNEKVTPSQDEMLCGGWSQAREVTQQELEMFLNITSSLGKTWEVKSVQTQVVAGLNYRFLAEAQAKSYIVRIFKPLPGQGEPKLVCVEEKK
ncbi:MAG: hypothetical protein KBS95_03795 [Alistipes sp.]|nr:hypothetical protein [Candidatus Alistipes equi]